MNIIKVGILILVLFLISNVFAGDKKKDRHHHGTRGVPEPTTMLLVGAGIAGIVGYRKYKKNKDQKGDL